MRNVSTLLILLIFLASSLAADDDRVIDPRFDHLLVSDGLSSSSVSSIIQDDRGLIWFGTQSGLNQYDGYRIERFEHDPFDRNSLSHNLIQTMHYDEHDTLWIGTYGGLNRFDPRSGEFVHFANDPSDPTTLSNNVVVALERDSHGHLWVGTLDGLNRLDESDGSFVRYLPDAQPSDATPASGPLPDKVVRAIARDRRGDLWIGTYGGLARYLPERDAFEVVSTQGEPGTTLPSPYVMAITPDPHDAAVLWVGTWDGGVSRFNTISGTVETITLPHNEIYTMMFDSRGLLWAGTWGNGLYIIDPATGDYDKVTANTTDPMGFSHDIVYSLLEDESGIVWIGTNGGGVNKYVPWENQLEVIKNSPDDPGSLAAGRVEAIHIDEDGTMWVGVYNGGLNRRPPGETDFVRYTVDPDDPSSLSNNIVNAVTRDSQGRLWVGTNRGLNLYLPEVDGFRRIFAGRSGGLPDYIVFTIEEGPSGQLWLGTNTSGVVVYDPETGATARYAHDPADPTSLSDNLVRSIAWDDRGNTWIGTNRGLNRLAPDGDGFLRYTHDVDDRTSISSNNIREVVQDERGRLWVATTGGGLNLYDYETDAFSLVSTADGLASDQVVGITIGRDGSLWLPTSRGISVYHPDTGAIRTWDSSDGLLSNELTRATALDSEGRIYFGGAAGITLIDTAPADEYAYSPPVLLTGFSVLGRPLDLQQTADGAYEPVVLGPEDSFFSFEFAALDYSKPNQNRYAYMLEGFDADWNDAGRRNYASYTNIAPGDYTLRIRGAGSRGNWSEEGVALPLIVEPPWWQTNAARAGYVVLAIAMISVAWLWMGRRQRLSARRLVEQERINVELERKVRERTEEIERSRAHAEQANLEKSRFLANMSHEIRTPLNGMLGMMSLLEKTPLEGRQEEYLRYSRVSAENLNTLVNDLLDFERIEAGQLRLVSETFSVEECARYIQHLFAVATREKDLAYHVDVLLEGRPDLVTGDRSRFVQVLTNLVSNAIKYTREGEIRVRITAHPATQHAVYQVEVQDTGIGMGADQQSEIFERFRQLDSGYSKAARGVGLGLAIVKQVVEAMGGTIDVRSAPGEGSCFTVRLPFPAAESSEPAGNRLTPRDDRVAQSRPAHESGVTGRPAILLCEDEAINQLYLTHHLTGLGYDVDVAADGEKAVRKATTRRYELILMDLGMPRMNGLEAARAIRDAEERNQADPVPIIALTAHTYQDDIERCYAAGMTDFLSKPAQESEIAAKLHAWIPR